MSRIKQERDTLTPGLRKFNDKLDRGLAGVTEHHATRAQSKMKTNARWTDRTTVARTGLGAKAFHEELHHSIVLYHTAPYGIWLEIANNGRYQIIMPTVLAEGVATMNSCRGLLERLGA